MFDIKVLSKEDTEKLLKMNDVINVVENVYKSKSEDKTCVFPLIFHEFEPGVADMDIKSGWMKENNIFGLKLVSWFGENIKKNLPALIGTIMVMDATTGVPIGILDGAHITGMRTGAAGALGAKYLARPDSKSLLIVGAGHVSTFQIAATLLLFPKIETVMIYDPINFDTANKKANTIIDTLNNNFGINVDGKVKFTAVKDIKEATGKSLPSPLPLSRRRERGLSKSFKQSPQTVSTTSAPAHPLPAGCTGTTRFRSRSCRRCAGIAARRSGRCCRPAAPGRTWRGSP